MGFINDVFGNRKRRAFLQMGIFFRIKYPFHVHHHRFRHNRSAVVRIFDIKQRRSPLVHGLADFKTVRVNCQFGRVKKQTARGIIFSIRAVSIFLSGFNGGDFRRPDIIVPLVHFYADFFFFIRGKQAELHSRGMFRLNAENRFVFMVLSSEKRIIGHYVT